MTGCWAAGGGGGAGEDEALLGFGLGEGVAFDCCFACAGLAGALAWEGDGAAFLGGISADVGFAGNVMGRQRVYRAVPRSKIVK